MDQLEHILDTLREDPRRLAVAFDLLRHRVRQWEDHPPAPGGPARGMAADLVRDALGLLAAADGLAGDVAASFQQWEERHRPGGDYGVRALPLLDRGPRLTVRIDDELAEPDWPAPGPGADTARADGPATDPINYDGPTDPIPVVDTGRLPAVDFDDLVYGGSHWRADPWRKRGRRGLRRSYA
jgi:hypothetical protein